MKKFTIYDKMFHGYINYLFRDALASETKGMSIKMITKRIIPCLDVKNGRVVKGVNFQGLADVSSPVELGRYYSDNGAD